MYSAPTLLQKEHVCDVRWGNVVCDEVRRIGRQRWGLMVDEEDGSVRVVVPDVSLTMF